MVIENFSIQLFSLSSVLSIAALTLESAFILAAVCVSQWVVLYSFVMVVMFRVSQVGSE